MIKTIRNGIASIGVKAGVVTVVMGILTALAVVSGLATLDRVDAELGTFAKRTVPNLHLSAELINKSSDISDSLSALFISGSDEEIASVQAKLDAELTAFSDRITQSNSDETQAMLGKISTLREDLSALSAARSEEMGADTTMLGFMAQMGAAAKIAKTSLAEIWETTMATAEGRDGAKELQRIAALGRLGAIQRLEHDLAELESVILNGASMDSPEDISASEELAFQLADEIGALALKFPGQATLTNAIAEFLTYAQPDTGILALRKIVVIDRGLQDEASQSATTLLSDLTIFARSIGISNRADLDKTTASLIERITTERTKMWTIAGTAAAVLLLAPFVLFFLIMHPMRSITRVTQAMAEGNTDPVPSYARHGGEIAKLADALTVFRQNILDQNRMQAEERDREVQARRDAERRDQEDRAREKDRLDRERAAEIARHEQEAQALQEREAQRAADEKERDRHRAEQDMVVRELAAGLEALAQGDLTLTIDRNFPQAYEGLRLNFNRAQQTLSDLVVQIADAVDQIKGNTTEISSAADNLSKRTEHSAATLEETAAALSELTASVEAAADGARAADTLSRDTNIKAENSKAIVQNAISAMSEIANSSDKISKIIDVIDDIAFQTNLLALNAGVEAARAGEAGRGFAVVASEVRALAQRSSDAANEINTLISTSTGLIRDGVKLVDNTGAVIQEIIQAVSEIANNVAAISASAQEQAAGIKEINTATGQLETSMQQNAAMTEETTAASMVLNNAAGQLQSLAQRFQTNGTTSGTGGFSDAA